MKRLIVKPGAKLSLQKHQYRTEHWAVVAGTTRAINITATILLAVNESTSIPKGVIHSLENPRETPLEIIQVQSGEYPEEDDIEGIEERYGRVDGEEN